MRYIDLHVHSNASDGTFTPTEVVQLAIQKNLAAIALSDHDTVNGIPEALQAAAGSTLEVIPATELSCYYQGIEIHILGFFVNHLLPSFLYELERLEYARFQRNLDMIERFHQNGIEMTMEDLQAGNPNSIITRAHFARVLVQKGICKDKSAAFRQYIGIGCPYYIPKPQVTPEHSLALITQAGGIPVLAHPMLYHLGYEDLHMLIKTLIPMGLAGIEAYHSSNYPEQSAVLCEMAEQYGMVVSGGSDFHGANKPDIELGSGRGNLQIPEELVEPIRRLHTDTHDSAD